MIQSMTGFGKAQYEDDQVFVRVEIKAVNSKGFDLKLKLPLDFNYKDAWARAQLQNLLHRGKIECFVTLERQDIVPYQINTNAARQYFETIKNLAERFGYDIKQVDALQIIMRLPDILKPVQIDEDETTWQKIWQTILQAVDALVEFRKQEGQALERDLREKVENIKNALEQVPQYEQERIETVKQRLLAALQELKIEYDKDRFEQELLYYLDKYDINEEKVRLANHIAYFLETLDNAGGEPVGKTLSFIAQEMGREINTLGAKANHFKIQQLVVRMKDNLEKIKEQLANVL